MIRKLILIAISFTFLGCASYFKRKQCEKVNWYEYGQNLAMNGTRPAGDSFIKECRDAEAEFSESQLDRGFKEGMNNYCKPDTVFATGKKGNKLNLDLCDPGQERILKARYEAGIKEYCQPENGFTVGSSGGVYKSQCSGTAEKSFLKEYRRGRKKFLNASILDLENRIRNSETKTMALQNENNQNAIRLGYLPAPRLIIEKVMDPATKAYKETQKEDDPYKQERQNLKTSIETKNNEIKNLQNEQNRLRDQIGAQKIELASLDD